MPRRLNLKHDRQRKNSALQSLAPASLCFPAARNLAMKKNRYSRRAEARASARLHAKMGVLPLHSRGNPASDVIEAAADHDVIFAGIGRLIAGRNLVGTLSALAEAQARVIAAASDTPERVRNGVALASVAIEEAAMRTFAYQQDLAK